MKNLGDMRKAISALVAEANAQGVNPADIIPTDVQAQFRDIAQLKDAQAYIKESDVREGELRQQLADAERKLQAAQDAIADMPEDHVHRLQELQIAKTSVEFYKNLHKDAEERASVFQSKCKAMADQKQNIDALQLRLDSAHQESDYQKSVIANLTSLNCSMRSMLDTAQATHERAMEEKSKQIQAMKDAQKAEEQFRQEQDEKYKDLDRERDEFEDTFSGLVTELESQTADAATALNAASVRRRGMEQLHMTLVSEVACLRRLFCRCADVLVRIHPHIKHQPNARFPEECRAGLKAASYELEAFATIHDAVSGGDGLDDVAHGELGGLGGSAKCLFDAVTNIASVHAGSQAVVRGPRSSGSWASFRAKLGGSESK